MKKFIKENWFKIIISLFLIFLLAIGVLFYLKYNQNNINISPEGVIEEKTQEIDTKTDEYVVTYGIDGSTVTWPVAELASAILDDTIITYKDSLTQIKEVQNKEEKTLDSIYTLLPKIDDQNSKDQMQTLAKYEKSYIDASGNLIKLLEDLVRNYGNLQNATKERNVSLYLYYSDKIKELESQKSSILDDYKKKQDIKQNYAKSIL